MCAHYEAWNMIRDKDGTLRLPSVAEREKLHLLKHNHTIATLKSSEAKHIPKLEYAERSRMVGDDFHHGVVAWVFAQLSLVTSADSRRFRRSTSAGFGHCTCVVARTCSRSPHSRPSCLWTSA